MVVCTSFMKHSVLLADFARSVAAVPVKLTDTENWKLSFKKLLL